MEPRHCIKCQETMVPRLVEEVEVDLCPGCHGLWLDRDEIHALGAKSDVVLEGLRVAVQAEANQPEAPTTTAQPCPACHGKLSVASLGTFSVEHCMECGGLFLDRGELDKVMALTRYREDSIATVVALARWVITSGSIDG
jgi:Zn-finger nucleic acid-binding protein